MPAPRKDAAERLMLLDSASLYFRAFFGVPDTTETADGTPNNAVRGLLDFIARLTSTHRPTHLVACWDDGWRPTWRVALIPTYKTHRVSGDTPDVEVLAEEEVPDRLGVQVPLIRQCLDALGIPIAGAEDFEADDVIGTLCAKAVERSLPVDVVTGDRDLFQLVDDVRGIRILYTAARGVGRAESYDEAALQAKYGVPARHYADFATMRGDSSDGLPGVKGVGEKTAAALITKYGNLDEIRAAAEDPSTGIAPGVRAKLKEAADYLDKAPIVVRVATDAPVGLDLDDARLPDSPAHPRVWDRLVEELALGSSARRVTTALAGGVPEPIER